METREEEIGFETVMDQPSEELREMTKVNQGLHASFGVDPIPSQTRVGQNVKPLQFPLNAQSCFIGMKDIGFKELGDDFCFKRGQRAPGGVDR